MKNFKFSREEILGHGRGTNPCVFSLTVLNHYCLRVSKSVTNKILININDTYFLKKNFSLCKLKMRPLRALLKRRNENSFVILTEHMLHLFQTFESFTTIIPVPTNLS